MWELWISFHQAVACCSRLLPIFIAINGFRNVAHHYTHAFLCSRKCMGYSCHMGPFSCSMSLQILQYLCFQKAYIIHNTAGIFLTSWQTSSFQRKQVRGKTSENVCGYTVHSFNRSKQWMKVCCVHIVFVCVWGSLMPCMSSMFIDKLKERVRKRETKWTTVRLLAVWLSDWWYDQWCCLVAALSANAEALDPFPEAFHTDE